jgi:hypothetical protein
MEKGLSNDFDNFGLTHEISFAYSFTPNLTEDRVMLEDNNEELVDNDQEGVPETALTSKDEEIKELKRRLAENDAILAELMFRQDSVETNRQKDLERRYEMAMNLVRRETNGQRPDLEEKVKKIYFINNDKAATAEKTPEDPAFESTKTTSEQVRDAVAVSHVSNTISPKATQDNTRQNSVTKTIQKKNVKRRKFRDLNGVEDGYYVVANVYKGGHYLNKFVNDLHNQGINADYIDNPNNGLKYVYLERYDSWQEAVEAHKTGLKGAYQGELWIMNVDNRYSNEAYVENTTKIREKSTKYGTDVLQKNVIVSRP